MQHAPASTPHPQPLTPAGLLALARTQGLSALGVEPRPNSPHKILLASLGLDVADPCVQSELIELNRAGAIELTRVHNYGLVDEQAINVRSI